MTLMQRLPSVSLLGADTQNTDRYGIELGNACPRRSPIETMVLTR